MDLLNAPIKDFLWHKMRQDLSAYFPEIMNNSLLMCCACGRFLPQEHFSLEHIVPRQALADDPKSVKEDPEATANIRSGNVLLCTKPLAIKGTRVFGNGCNSWKGRFYDRSIRELLNGRAFDEKLRRISTQQIIAAASAAYLAMVSHYGYQVALTPAGLLMRYQFFMPTKFHRDMPMRSQMLLGGQQPKDPKAPLWTRPFTFRTDRGFCIVGFRNFVVALPLSRDPDLPIVKHLLIAPSKYAMRPNFKSVFD